jgi:glucose/arabinose dehydrogenase
MPRAVVLVAIALAACGDNREPEPERHLALELRTVQLEGAPIEAFTEMAFVPGSSEFLVLNKNGVVGHYRLDSTGLRASRIGTFEVPGVDETADCGLLSVAFDPEFASNHLVYFASCESTKFSRITRHVFDPGDYRTIATSAATVFRAGTDAAQHAWHNIGSIGFDRTGAMWALLGDKTVASAAQDLTGVLGTVVRIIPDRVGAGATPAPDNPFIGDRTRRPEIAAYGLRSPWRGALDHRGRLWIGDVGESSFEEVDVTRFSGENFGASIVEGPCGDACGDVTAPIVTWDHTATGRYHDEDPRADASTRRVVWVGMEYPRTTPVDRYHGLLFDKMLLGDFAGGWIRAVALDDSDQVVSDEHVGHFVGPTSWVLGPDGYIYVSGYGSALALPYLPGAVSRVVLVEDGLR